MNYKKLMKPHLNAPSKLNPIFMFPSCSIVLGTAEYIREFELQCHELAIMENISFEQAKHRIIEYRKTHI